MKSFCQESNPRPRRYFRPRWPLSQTVRWKIVAFICLWNHSVPQNAELSFPYGLNFICQVAYILSPKIQVSIYSDSVCRLSKFGDLKLTIDEKWYPQISDLRHASSSKAQKHIFPQENCDCLWIKYFINVNRLSWSTDSRKAQKLELCFGTKHRTDLAKIVKISISQLKFLRSLGNDVAPYDMKLIIAISGAKKSPLAREPSKYWGTCGARTVSTACGCGEDVHHVAAARML